MHVIHQECESSTCKCHLWYIKNVNQAHANLICDTSRMWFKHMQNLICDTSRMGIKHMQISFFCYIKNVNQEHANLICDTLRMRIKAHVKLICLLPERLKTSWEPQLESSIPSNVQFRSSGLNVRERNARTHARTHAHTYSERERERRFALIHHTSDKGRLNTWQRELWGGSCGKLCGTPNNPHSFHGRMGSSSWSNGIVRGWWWGW
jgi:hypothetical protein